jgi:hypothetical protein
MVKNSKATIVKCEYYEIVNGALVTAITKKDTTNDSKRSQSWIYCRKGINDLAHKRFNDTCPTPYGTHSAVVPPEKKVNINIPVTDILDCFHP